MWLNASESFSNSSPLLEGASQFEIAVGDIVGHRPELRGCGAAGMSVGDTRQKATIAGRCGGQEPGQDRRDSVNQDRLGPFPGRDLDLDRADHLHFS